MKRYLIFYLVLGFSAFSCSDYFDINENPNGATTPPIEGLMANVTYNSGINTYSVSATSSYYTQYLASPNEGSDTDSQVRVNTDGAWTGIYRTASALYDLIHFAEETNSNHYVGLGQVLMAFNLGLAVDVYGDIPYSEAFDFGTTTPAYDGDQSIYAEVFDLLDKAIVNLGNSTDGIPLDGASDFIHHGDTEAWIKTAYALKARYLNHLSKTDGYNPDAVLEALSNAYGSNSDDAQVEEYQNRNPWNQVAINNANLVLGGWLSAQVIDAMNGVTFGVFDPRLPLITEPTADGDYVGTENGRGRIGSGTDNEEVYLVPEGYYSSPDAPLFLITYAELKFIEAEVLLRKNNDKAAAYEAYLEGIRAHMNKLGVNQADINSYLDHSSVGVGSSNFDLKTVFKEKYIALFLQPESWVDARRIDYNYTDFELPYRHNPQLQGEFIRRFDYPDTERQRNAKNIPSVDLSSRIWWDKN